MCRVFSAGTGCDVGRWLFCQPQFPTHCGLETISPRLLQKVDVVMHVGCVAWWHHLTLGAILCAPGAQAPTGGGS